MKPRIINGFEDFIELQGQELGVSDYLVITQERINQFADATLDHQWIHTDPERARAEAPFGGTIAHGYLTLSILPYLWLQIVDVRNVKMMVNYGIDDFRFKQPVKVNDALRLRVWLISATNLRGIIKMRLKAVLEIRDNSKPVFEGYFLFLYHFNS